MCPKETHWATIGASILTFKTTGREQGGSKDVFVHISAVERAGLSSLNEGQVVEYEEVSEPRQNVSRKPESSALSFVKSPPTNHCSFDASAGFCVFPQALAPPAREWYHIGPDVILAEDLEWLVVRRASLVNEIVDALLARCQFRSLPNKRTLSAESS